MTEIGDRVHVSYEVLGHPQSDPVTRPVTEGLHYTVLAYTDWGDLFTATVIKWNHGAVDSFTDLMVSLGNRQVALKGDCARARR